MVDAEGAAPPAGDAAGAAAAVELAFTGFYEASDEPAEKRSSSIACHSHQLGACAMRHQRRSMLCAALCCYRPLKSRFDCEILRD